ncbi:flavodoxin family protein [Methanolobus sp. ZRKC3]|uniref:flavodoxin family protein n=1 Tax=Methanolobus sp. ZRKC3 TaxID=3125786 RepID=UPI0032508279
MKVVAFVGSPRKNGNTDVLVQQVLDGAVEAGADVEKFYINDMDFKGCQGCGYCRNTEICKLDDDMTKAYDAIKNADGVVFGSPIYFFQMTGQMRLFLDRCYALLNNDHTPRIDSGKKAVIVGAQGAPDAAAFTGVYEEFSNVLKQFMGMDVKDTIVDVGHHAPGEAKENTELMEQAKSAGINLFE